MKPSIIHDIFISIKHLRFYNQARNENPENFYLIGFIFADAVAVNYDRLKNIFYGAIFYSTGIKFDELVKSQKIDFILECLVFGIWYLVFSVLYNMLLYWFF
ncbi:MAG: hypothetical protein KKH68_03800, partial [Proteobacteria bacterium]|nr:hypothetical protein [Pseudomonadota bacterium]